MSSMAIKRVFWASGLAFLLFLLSVFGLNCGKDQTSVTCPVAGDQKALYVATSSRGEFAEGTSADPLPSLSIAIRKSKWMGSPHPPVYVAAGTYRDDVAFVGGVSIYGGYDPDTWIRVDTLYSTFLVYEHPLRADSIVAKTVISGLTIKAADAVVPGASSVALRVGYCTDSLIFESCRFVAGKGADGQDGADGARGSYGQDGQNAYYDWPGDGGDASCIMNGQWKATGGGQGGMKNGMDGTSRGLDGEGLCPGAGGAYQINGSNATCKGSDGANGSGGTSHGQIVAEEWIPNAGVSGADGEPGSGGGGGGAYWTIMESCGGGGGGGGACGGGGGVGGQGGGSSFAVYLDGASPVFRNSVFVTGKGGDGGAGGDGGYYGSGGFPGVGGRGVYGNGGTGGHGSDGGSGGGGQGGPGGSSICILKVGTCNPQSPGSTFSPNTAGAGGAGGQRRVLNPSYAAPGAAGVADTIRQY